jgi:ElaB/YqjD/DUF883 family membrane-anchored ribosome-binding protein
MDQEPDVIRRQIDETRSSLTEKLETLEGQVRCTVENAKASVEDTIQNVRSSVRDTVHSVKQTLDVRYQTAHHPWAMFGSSVAVGFLVGNYLGRRGVPQQLPYSQPQPALGNGFRAAMPQREFTAPEPASRPEPTSRKEAEPGLFSKLLHQFDNEIGKLKEVAIGAAVGWARDLAKEQLPQLAPHIDEIMNSAAEKLGGTPIRQSMVDPGTAWDRRTART